MNADASRPVILTVDSVSKIYRMGEVDVPALRDASLEIHEGEVLVIAGPSGSGKSTLINIIGGIDRPTSGTVFFRDQDLTAASDSDLTLYRRNHVGFVFQLFNLIPTLTARENVEVATEIVQDPLDSVEALRLVDLADRADHFPSQLSGGEQQRVAIARALVSNPQLLLCDEPTGALDTQTGRQVLELLSAQAHQSGRSVIWITHNTAIAQAADRVATLRDGRIASVETNAKPVPASEVSW